MTGWLKLSVCAAVLAALTGLNALADEEFVWGGDFESGGFAGFTGYRRARCKNANCNASGVVAGNFCADCLIGSTFPVSACSVWTTDCPVLVAGGVIVYNPTCYGTCVSTGVGCTVDLMKC